MSPLFDYQCPVCRHVDQNVWTPSINTLLPWCECGEQMRKMYGSFTPRFIGPGFFENDYKKVSHDDKQDADSRG